MRALDLLYQNLKEPVGRELVLINLYNLYFPMLVENQTLLVALKRLSPNRVLHEQITASPFQEGNMILPSTVATILVKDRITEIEDMTLIIFERVKAITEAIHELRNPKVEEK